MTALQPLGGSSAAHSFAYYGEREGWLIALQVNRDSDALERSNWDVIVPAMLIEHPDNAAIERMNHWAVGWVDYLLVRPDSPAAVEAQRWADKLADYPVADEEHFSELEWSEEWCVRCDRGTRADHDAQQRCDCAWPTPEHIAQHRRPRYGTCGKFRSADNASEIRWRWRDHRGIADAWFEYRV